MRDSSYKEKAIRLRREGYSYNLIREHVPVSKSTLSLWLRDVPYTPNQAVVRRIGRARALSGKAKHDAKMASIQIAARLAAADLKVHKNQKLLCAGLGLYMGEGEKNQTVGIANADPKLIALFIHWLEEIYGITVDHLTLAVHAYTDTDSEVCEQYWSDVTGIPREQFGKIQIDMRKKTGGIKKNRLPYGTAHVRVRSNGKKEFGVLLSRRIEEGIRLFQQQCGIS